MNLVLGILLFLFCQVEAGSSQLHNNIAASVRFSAESIYSQAADSVKVDLLIERIKLYRFSEPETAISLADTALSLSREADLKTREAEVLNQLGIIASVQGNSPKALEYFLDVLRVREEIGDVPGISRIQNNLGILYKNLGDYERSLEFHLKSLESKKLLNDSLGIARSLNNIGEIYQQRSEIIRSQQYFEQALELMLLLDFREGLAAVYNNLGEVYKLRGEINSAIEYHTLSLEIEKELENLSGAGISYLNIASLFLLVEQPDIAINNYMQAIYYFRLVDDLSGLEKAYHDLATTYSGIENFEESLYYFQLYSDLKDSLKSLESNRQLTELQTKYESEQQKKEIELLSERASVQELEIKQQSRTRNLLVIITLLLLTIAFVLYRSNKSRKVANKLLVEKNKKIEEAAQLKAQFLSVMSHEIRTPMNAVVGMTNLLIEENPRDDQKAFLETLRFSSNNLLSIVNDVLDYNKAELGKIELESIQFRPLLLLSNIHNSFYQQAIHKKLYFKIELDEKIPDALIGDPTRLTQILNNLISNALKFTHEGSVVVDVSLKEQTYETATLEFRVTDTGIGIPEEKQHSIFESFIQASTETHRKYGGSGLGLAITKKLIELFEGEIRLVSTAGKGTTFLFHISFKKSTKNSVSAESLRDRNNLESLEGVKLLLVEDNPINIQVIKLFLKRWDVKPDVSLNGETAVQKVQENSYDAVLMDLHMPIMDGYQATKQIRNLGDNQKKSVPIIALTASNLFEEHTLAYEVGVDDIVPKPFNPEELHHAIYKAIGLEEKNTGLD